MLEWRQSQHKKGTIMFEHCESWKVVISIEDQYSVWPTFKDIPAGWQDVGKTGTKEECLNYIKEVWVDMRPRSLRNLMDKKNTE
jgi:MbtH protein